MNGTWMQNGALYSAVKAALGLELQIQSFQADAPPATPVHPPTYSTHAQSTYEASSMCKLDRLNASTTLVPLCLVIAWSYKISRRDQLFIER